MQQRWIISLAAIVLVGWLSALPAMAEKRVALVIGINDYRDVPPLKKAVGDAEAIGSALQGIGFTVAKVTNVGRRDLNRGLADLERMISPGDTVLVHFSGHGVEIDGENYLLPADIPKPQSGDRNFLKEEAVSLGSILARLDATGAATRILIVDACRDNPFAKTGTRGIGGERGLARVEAPKGTFIMYSAGYGQTALDRLGDGDPVATSVFARVLLKHLSAAGREITDIAKDVRSEVASIAGTVAHEQRPAYYDELTGRFYLVPPEVVTQLPAAPAADAVATDFQLAKDVNTAEAWDAFLAKHGSLTGNFHVDLARAARQKLAAVSPLEQQPASVAGPEPQQIAPTPPAAASSATDAEAGLTKDQRMQIEVALMKQRADPGDIDGDFDSDARAGIKSWQYTSGFEPTGILEPSQIKSLLSSASGKGTDSSKIAMAYSQPPDGADERLHRAIDSLRGRSFVHRTFDGHLYVAVIVDNAAGGISFQRARELAERTGGKLACVSSAAENKALFEMIREDPRFWWTNQEDGHMSGPWIGLYQAPGSRSSKQGWVWVDGCKSSYRNWKGGQPNEIDLGAGPGAAAFGGLSARKPTPGWADAILLKQTAPGLIIEIE